MARVRHPGRRMEYRGRSFHYQIVEQPQRPFSDLYHFLMRGSIWRLLIFSSGAYVISIAFFGGLFWLGGDCIEGARSGSILDSFWFSVQTFSTIGYGGFLPKTPYAHALVTVESFIGLAGVAVVTALLYSRFARPTARVSFAANAVVCERNGVPTLQVRLANERHTGVMDARIRLTIIVDTVTQEGQSMRRSIDLDLERDNIPILITNWTVIHRLDERSPLYGLSADNVHEKVILLMASFVGTDEALMQNVRVQYPFLADDIVFGRQFMDMIERHDEGLVMRWSKLNGLQEPNR